MHSSSTHLLEDMHCWRAQLVPSSGLARPEAEPSSLNLVMGPTLGFSWMSAHGFFCFDSIAESRQEAGNGKGPLDTYLPPKFPAT